MTGKRTRYTAELKAKVALEALRGELTTAQLAAKHGILMSGLFRGLRRWPSWVSSDYHNLAAPGLLQGFCQVSRQVVAGQQFWLRGAKYD
jgi:hypothetical protein